MNIRAATAADESSISLIYKAAFPEEEADSVVRLALELLLQPSSAKTTSLIAESADDVVGHVAFSPVTISEEPQRAACILAPLAVRPEFQRQGIARTLVENGMNQLQCDGVQIVFVYGDPALYGRFGFYAELAAQFSPPCPLTHPFGWQAKAMTEDVRDSSGQIRCVAALSQPELW